MTKGTWVTTMWVLIAATLAMDAAAQAPPAPVLVAPANGAALLQPITLRWQAIVDPDGPIGSYTWEVSTSSTFGTVIASGFNNADGDVPLPTQGQLSGLANGIYFWRVKAAQDIGPPTGFIDSPCPRRAAVCSSTLPATCRASRCLPA